jgi:uncharacterized glyoxalase superfamily protein PhnB
MKEDFVMVKPIPDGYSSITPYLIFEDAKSAIDFYGKAFGAQELFRMPVGDPMKPRKWMRTAPNITSDRLSV